MKHGKREVKTLFLIGMSLVFVATLQGQSVVDLARKQRIRRPPQTGRVYTNEDVRSLPPSTPIPSAPAPAAPAPAAPTAAAARPAGQAPGAAATAAPGTAAAPSPGQTAAQPAAGAPPPQKSEAELEKEYRDKFAKLREELSLQERRLDVMQRELNLMQIQNYTNPQDALTQELTRTNINTRMQEIETQKANVDKAKQAVADLEEELRVKGLPAGWAR